MGREGCEISVQWVVPGVSGPGWNAAQVAMGYGRGVGWQWPGATLGAGDPCLAG